MFVPGDQIGRFRILSRLGEGGMGSVFVAEDPLVERKVALKVLKAELCARPEVVTRFFNEARAVNRIQHEHIIEVTELAKAPTGEVYLVMELLNGCSLGTRLKQEKSLPLQRTLHIILQIADALAASHEMGIVHRDLKPDNVFLITRSNDPDYVKLLDFGIAKLVVGETEAKAHTNTGSVLGTAKYMSPEQCLGRTSQIDHRTDIYGLGVMTYQLLTGRVPFDAEGWGEILVMHVHSPFPLVRELLPDLPAGIDEILQKAVAKRREERWQTMGELQEALSAFYDRATYQPPKMVKRQRAPALFTGSTTGNSGSWSGSEKHGHGGPVSDPSDAFVMVPGSSPSIGRSLSGSVSGSAPDSLAGSLAVTPSMLLTNPSSSSMISGEVVGRPARGKAFWAVLLAAILGTAGAAVGITLMITRGGQTGAGEAERGPAVTAGVPGEAAAPALVPPRPAAAPPAPVVVAPPPPATPPAAIAPAAPAAAGATPPPAIAPAVIPPAPAGAVAPGPSAPTPASPIPAVAGPSAQPAEHPRSKPGRPGRRPGKPARPAHGTVRPPPAAPEPRPAAPPPPPAPAPAPSRVPLKLKVLE